MFKSILFLLAFTSIASADVKISQLPLKSAATTNVNDSFPYVNFVAGETDRLDLSDLINLPTLSAALSSKQATGNYITGLTGDVSAAGPGNVVSVVNSVGTSSAANIHSGEVLANGATAVNISNRIVLRDSTGKFAATQITSDLVGNVTGNVTGNLTGNVTGNVTGTASGNTTYTPSQYGVVVSGSGNAMSVVATDASANKTLHSGGSSANPAYSLVALASDVSGTLPNGNTTATSAATASTIASRDSSANMVVNNLIDSYATTATAAGTTTLTVGSAYTQYFTGSTTQTVVLPDATTLALGQSFYIVNLSSGIVTVNKNGGTLVQTMAAGSFMTVTATNIGSAAGTWNPSYSVNNAGGGTVTSVTFTGDGVIDSSTPSSAVTTTGTVTATIKTQSATTVLAGPLSGSAAAPTFRVVNSADFFPPTIHTYLSGSGTYNLDYTFTITSGSATVGATYTNNAVTFTVYATVASATRVVMSGSGAPAASGTLTKASGTGDATLTFSAANSPISLDITMVGAGGGGAGSGTSGGTSATSGTASTFGSGLLSAGGGGNANFGGAANNGGTSSLGTGPLGIALTGGSGGGYIQLPASPFPVTGGMGGNSAFGGGGAGGQNASGTGFAGLANTGGGGGGGGQNNVGSVVTGSGGGAGGFVSATITSPAASYPYVVGVGGTAGGNGASGLAGGAGADGLVRVVAKFQ